MTNTNVACAPMNHDSFVRGVLKIGEGMFDEPANEAARMLGVYGFAARRKKRRLAIIERAQQLARGIARGKFVRIQPDTIVCALVDEPRMRKLLDAG